MGQISYKKANGVEKQLREDMQLPTTSVGQGSQNHPQGWKSGGTDANTMNLIMMYHLLVGCSCV